MDQQRRVWLEERKKGLGGTDIAALCGLHPYKSAFDVFVDKTTTVTDAEDVAPSEAAELGRELEPVVINRYRKRTGHEVTSPGPYIVYPAEPWRRGSLDGVAIPAGGKRRVVEAKTAGFSQEERWGEEGTDQVPPEYLLQVAWYMSLADVEEADIAVLLLASRAFKVFTVKRDLELEQKIVNVGREFWEKHVLPGIPPDIDGSKAAKTYLAARYPRHHTDALLPPSVESNEWAERLKLADVALAKASDIYVAAENHLKAIIGEAAGIQGPDYRITWKASRDSVVTDYEAVLKSFSERVGKPVPAELIVHHSKNRAGSRRFLFKAERE